MMENLRWLLFSALLCCYISDAYKILTMFPVSSKSHGILGDAFVRHLLNAGHEVTYVTPFIKKNPHPNLHQVDVTANKELFNENLLDIKLILNKQIDFKDIDFLNDFMSNISIATLGNENMLNLLQDPKEHFDVVIGEWMFSELYSVIPAVFECPYIWFSTLEPHWLILSLIDEPLNPAYNPDYGDSIQPPFTFSQRLYVLYKQIEGLYLKKYRYHYKEEAAYLRLVAPILKQRGLPVPTFQELKYNASMVLGNSHVSLGGATKLPQNYKNIGGYHIEEPVKPLPEDLQKVMDNAKLGIIYFSLGSNLNSKDLPTETKKGLLNVFKGLKQTVIWKFEEVLPDLPKNVHVIQWAPQPSILAHPNCVLFITHGGLLSLTEAVHYAVPLIALPVFADQFINAERVANKGFGVKLEISYTMHEKIGDAIKEVLGNPKYTEKVKELSLIYHDRPVKPGAELVHWVEHVVRTRGAVHLRSPALHVPLYQKLYLDLVALIIIAVWTIKSILKRMLYIIKNKSETKEKVN